MDRGNKLWEGHRMVLPEHVELFQLRRKERYVPPVVDEQQTEEWNRRIEQARREGRRLRWTAYGESGPYHLEGRVGRIHPVEGWIEVMTDEGKVKISIRRLLDVQIL